MGPDERIDLPIAGRHSLRASRARRAVRLGVTLALGASAAGAAGAVAQEPAAAPAPAPSPAPAPAPLTPTAATRAVQRALGLRPDGIAGSRTRRAVRRFQRRAGLVADGIVGPATLAALGIAAAASTTTPPAADASAEALARIARCESGGNPAAVSPDGRFRGKYQFTRPTWRALGGSGDPAAAPEAEQDRLAALLLAQRGTAPWPGCA